MVEYRAVPDADVDAFRGVLDYAFRAAAGPTPDRDEGANPLADWNEGPFAVEARDGAMTVEPDSGARPDAAVPVETLSRLALGATSAERATLAGRLDADAGTAALLDALFPRRETFLREFF